MAPELEASAVTVEGIIRELYLYPGLSEMKDVLWAPYNAHLDLIPVLLKYFNIFQLLSDIVGYCLSMGDF